VDIARSIPYSGLNYLAYEFYKNLFLRYDQTQSGVYARLLAGGAGGVTAMYGLRFVFSSFCLSHTLVLVQSQVHCISARSYPHASDGRPLRHRTPNLSAATHAARRANRASTPTLLRFSLHSHAID
jgi:hypothetical protein